MKSRKYKIIEDCYCEGYLHEVMNYPRKWLKERKLKKGDKVKLIKVWTNFYGAYFKVKRRGIEYDIPKSKLTPLI